MVKHQWGHVMSHTAVCMCLIRRVSLESPLIVAASLISPWFLWWPPAESHYNIYDNVAVGCVSHAHYIVLLHSVGNKIATTTTTTRLKINKLVALGQAIHFCLNAILAEHRLVHTPFNNRLDTPWSFMADIISVDGNYSILHCLMCFSIIWKKILVNFNNPFVRPSIYSWK